MIRQLFRTSIVALSLTLFAGTVRADDMTATEAAPATAEAPANQEAAPVPAALNFSMTSLDGKPVNLADYLGKVVLVVNVASKCGNTKQYTPLQALYDAHKDEGLVVLGVPANNFGGQEPGSDEDIAAFCSTKYNVTFDMLSKVSVKGPDTCEFYKYLTGKDKGHAFGGDVTWNFEKFLIGRDGTLINRFAPKVQPNSPEVTKAVEAALAAK